MALDPLVTTADLQDRLGRVLTSDEAAKAPAFMRDASAAVRKYTRQQFTRVEDDTASLPVVGGKVRLPQRPADRPTAVSYRDELSDVESTLSGYTFDGCDVLDLSYRGYVGNVSSRWGSHINRVSVTYSHGFDEIPDDVIAVTAAAVLRTLLGPGFDRGTFKSESLGDYRYEIFEGVTVGSVTLNKSDQDALAIYRRRVGTTALQ